VAGVLQGVTGLDAEQRLVRARVFMSEVVDVAGGDEGQAGGFRDLRQRHVHALLDFEAGVLDLDECGLRAEDVAKSAQLRFRFVTIAVLQGLADAAREATGQGDQAFRALRKELPVDPRLVVVPLEKTRRGELDQVRVALVRLGQKSQVRVALRLRAAIVGDVDLAADNRLDSLLSSFAVELDSTGERTVIRERDRGHLELGRAGGKVGNAARSVEDRVLGVDVQVDERRLRHGRPILAPRSDGSGSRAQPPAASVVRRGKAGLCPVDPAVQGPLA
jgi:hypothetical protein